MQNRGERRDDTPEPVSMFNLDDPNGIPYQPTGGNDGNSKGKIIQIIITIVVAFVSVLIMTKFISPTVSKVDFDKNLGNVATDIGVLKTKINTADENYNTINKTLGNYSKDFETLKNKVDSLQTPDLSGYAKTVDLESLRASIQNAINNNSAENLMREQIKALSDANTQLTNSNSQLKTDLTTMQVEVVTAQSAITALQSEVTALKSKIPTSTSTSSTSDDVVLDTFGAISVEYVKQTDKLGDLAIYDITKTDAEQLVDSVDFSVKLTNTSDYDIEDICITGIITCSKWDDELEMHGDFPTMESVSVSSWYVDFEGADYEWDEDGELEFEVDEMTNGTSFRGIELEAGDYCKIKPQINFLLDKDVDESDIDSSYTFEIEIIDITYND